MLNSEVNSPLTKESRELYSKLNFNFFLYNNTRIANRTNDLISTIEKQYIITINHLRKVQKKNKQQFHYLLEGEVKQMHLGDFLENHFMLNNVVEFEIIDAKAYGESWAYFELWAKREKIKRRKKIFWKRLVEIGAVLGYILTTKEIIKIFIN
ncbi:MAG: hypothetical protein IPN61_09700 [Bacteroidetes bacterium]|nr:hypothetical protein [Bacteroidota bacterium]